MLKENRGRFRKCQNCDIMDMVQEWNGRKCVNIRKRMLAAGMVTVVLISLACSGLAGCRKKEVTEEKKKQVITLWHYWDMSFQKKTLSRLIDQFNQSQDEIEVKTRYIPDADFKKELALSMYENEMPDIALVDSSDFLFFQNAKSFVDLSHRVYGIEEYMPEALEPCTVGNKIMGLPVGVNCVGLIYNAQMLREAGLSVPSTWEEFYETARALTKDGVYGYVQSTLESEESIYTFLPVFWSMGGDTEDLTSADSRASYELMRRMADEGIISRQSGNLTGKDLTMQFAKGKIAMMAGNSIQAEYIREKNPELEVEVTYMPTDGERITVQGGEIFCVTEGKHVEEAITFLNYISENERMAEYIDDLGYLAAKKEILKKQYPDNPICHSYIEMLSYARTREKSERWPEISAVMIEALDRSINDEASETEILQDAKDKIQKIRRAEDEER